MGILANLALVIVVALAGHNVIGDLVGCLSDIWAEFVDEAIWCDLLVVGMIGIDTHWAVEVDGRVRPADLSVWK